MASLGVHESSEVGSFHRSRSDEFGAHEDEDFVSPQLFACDEATQFLG